MKIRKNFISNSSSSSFVVGSEKESNFRKFLESNPEFLQKYIVEPILKEAERIELPEGLTIVMFCSDDEESIISKIFHNHGLCSMDKKINLKDGFRVLGEDYYEFDDDNNLTEFIYEDEEQDDNDSLLPDFVLQEE